MYTSTLSITSGLDGVGGQRHAPAALPPGMTRYPLYRRLGGPQGQVGRVSLLSGACPALLYFSTSHKWHEFRKPLLNTNMRFDFLYDFFLKHFSF